MDGIRRVNLAATGKNHPPCLQQLLSPHDEGPHPIGQAGKIWETPWKLLVLKPRAGERDGWQASAVGSSSRRPAHLFLAPPFLSLLFQSALAGIPRKVLGESKYSSLGTCPLKELGHFGRIFLPYAHFPFLPSTLSLTCISPSPLQRCRSHVFPIFLQKNPSNLSRQLRIQPVPEQLQRVGQQTHPQGLVPSPAPPAPMAQWRHLLSFSGGSSPRRGLAGAGSAPAIPAGIIFRQSNQAPPL